ILRVQNATCPIGIKFPRPACSMKLSIGPLTICRYRWQPPTAAPQNGKSIKITMESVIDHSNHNTVFNMERSIRERHLFLQLTSRQKNGSGTDGLLLLFRLETS